MQHFVNNDTGYLRWVESFPHGYVVNCYRRPSPTYLMLHRATCQSVTTDKQTNYTTRDYSKMCSEDLPELEKWATDTVRGELTPCRQCQP